MVALVALIVLTVLGVATMGDVINQSSVVRNEQFRQSVFYATSSELNVQIDRVNRNTQNEDDQIILDLLNSSLDGKDMELDITYNNDPRILTNPVDSTLGDVKITGNRLKWCPGESVNKVNAIAGSIEATATLDDGRGSIRSSQRQRYIYCWP